MKRLRIGFLTFHNYLDRNAWSGTLYYMQKALRDKNIELVYLGEIKRESLLQKVSRRLWRNDASSKIGSPSYIAKCQKFADTAQKKLAQTPCDVIFAPVASAELNFLETNIPIIYLSDATFKLYGRYYQLNLEQQEAEWLEKQESIAISKASKLVYSSKWAADSAIADYQADGKRIAILPFGANIDAPPLAKAALSNKKTAKCQLLFVAKDWQRKGGEIAFKTLVALCNRGIDAALTVVGCVPPAEIKHDKLTVIPFLNKNVPEQRKQLDDLFLKSNFFILPTRADCSPIVLCEANAFGLPVLTSDVGGIPSIVRKGKNGYMLPLSASGEDYANLIVENFSDKTQYEKLVRSSREEYNTRLNWNKWAEDLHYIMMGLLEQKNHQKPVNLRESTSGVVISDSYASS
jgi:glycosyltransferase involved in cell wall biosynthesis